MSKRNNGSKKSRENKNFQLMSLVNSIKFIITCSLMSLLLSTSAIADGDANPITLNVNPDEAQSVSINGTNPQAMALNTEANQQNQQQALSKGKNFVTSAPDPNNNAYWAQKNAANMQDAEAQEEAQAVSKMNHEKNEPVDQARLEKESEGLKNILTQWSAKKPSFQSVLFDGAYNKQNISGGIGANAFHPVTALPGTLWYATMADGADSYVPGVVRIQLQEGPFAGGYALGKFQIAPDGVHLILTFNTLSYGNTSFPISAVAIDPDSQIPGVTGNIDHHFMVRYVIPGAMGFLQGAVNLLKANSTVVVNGTTSTVSGPELSDAQLGLLMLSSAADRLQDATTPQGVLKLPEVKIAPGAGIGFLLLKSV